MWCVSGPDDRTHRGRIDISRLISPSTATGMDPIALKARGWLVCKWARFACEWIVSGPLLSMIFEAASGVSEIEMDLRRAERRRFSRVGRVRCAIWIARNSEGDFPMQVGLVGLGRMAPTCRAGGCATATPSSVTLARRPRSTAWSPTARSAVDPIRSRNSCRNSRSPWGQNPIRDCPDSRMRRCCSPRPDRSVTLRPWLAPAATMVPRISRSSSSPRAPGLGVSPAHEAPVHRSGASRRGQPVDTARAMVLLLGHSGHPAPLAPGTREEEVDLRRERQTRTSSDRLGSP